MTVLCLFVYNDVFYMCRNYPFVSPFLFWTSQDDIVPVVRCLAILGRRRVGNSGNIYPLVMTNIAMEN